MKINVGCGKMILDGWVNCDVQRNPKAPRAPELLCDARSIPLADGCADTVMALHLIEHFYYWEVPAVLAEWRRLLGEGGQLILELPDIEKCARNLLKESTDQMSMWGFYGDPGHKDPFMCHRWGYTPKTLTKVLEANGFDRIKFTAPLHHGRRDQRDMRVMARKA
jgi:predicted SAM-dependent methyltransferase